jgi:hypothetical protein
MLCHKLGMQRFACPSDLAQTSFFLFPLLRRLEGLKGRAEGLVLGLPQHFHRRLQMFCALCWACHSIFTVDFKCSVPSTLNAKR